jgi:uncharacterized membrane protein
VFGTGQPSSEARAINAGGIIVGQDEDPRDGFANADAWVRENGVVQQLPELSDGHSGASGINQYGTIVGHSKKTSGGRVTRCSGDGSSPPSFSAPNPDAFGHWRWHPLSGLSAGGQAVANFPSTRRSGHGQTNRASAALAGEMLAGERIRTARNGARCAG